MAYAKTLIHQSHIPPIHLSPSVTSHLLPFTCLLSFLAAFLLHPLFPFAASPFVSLQRTTPTYSHKYICIILAVQVRQTYLRILAHSDQLLVHHPHHKQAII